MNNQILIDSSFLYAVYHTHDKNHTGAMQFVDSSRQVPLVPDVILPEVAFLFVRDVGYFGVEKFLVELAKTEIELQMLTLPDLRRASQILQAYPDANFDLVDACIMALAERLDITQVCTFDRRDFSIYRPTHCDHLELLP